MDSKTIKEALLKGERVTLECKRAKAEVPKSVWQTYSAFANTIGGLILLGVDEDLQEKDVSKRFHIIGVDEPHKIVTDFWNTHNSDKVNENILVDSDVEVVNMDGVQIVCIHVPQGYIEDRQTGREGLTLAGLMMFGKGLAIRDRFSNFRMDYLDMSHLVGDERYHDRLTYDGLWENNLYQFFRIVSRMVAIIQSFICFIYICIEVAKVQTFQVPSKSFAVFLQLRDVWTARLHGWNRNFWLNCGNSLKSVALYKFFCIFAAEIKSNKALILWM